MVHPPLEWYPRKALRGGIQKSILTDFSGNVGDSRQMLTKTGQWLQERGWVTPTKGLLWTLHPKPSSYTLDAEARGGRCRAPRPVSRVVCLYPNP